MSSVRPFGPVYSLTTLLRACAVLMHVLLPALNVITLSVPSSSHWTVPVVNGHFSRTLRQHATPGPRRVSNEKARPPSRHYGF